MRVLGIAGSLRSGSLNRELLRLAALSAPEGVEFETWDGLRDIPPYDTDDEGTDPAAVEAFREAVRSADAVLIVTPEYNGSVPGPAEERARLGVAPRGAHLRLPQQAGRRDEREPGDVRRRLGRRRPQADPRPDGRPRRRLGARLPRAHERLATPTTSFWRVFAACSKGCSPNAHRPRSSACA